MSAIPKPLQRAEPAAADPTSAVEAMFSRFLPAVQTHANIQFRHLPEHEREEAVAEVVASAYANIHDSLQRGNGHRLRPSTVARYAVLQVKDGRHVGGRNDSKCDVLSKKAQWRHGFHVVGLPWDDGYAYDCLKDPSAPVWKQVLLEDKTTPVPDQAAFRIDWSDFLRQQHDRTRTALAMLAEGYRQTEVADRLGVTRAAVCQRVKKAEREWIVLQDEGDGGEPVDQASMNA